MGKTKPSMFCHRCGYVLDGLNTNRCPECGRPFDPRFERTYRRPGALSRSLRSLIGRLSLRHLSLKELQAALAVASACYGTGYTFVIFAAYMTSGTEVFSFRGAYYAALAPLGYCLYSLLTAFLARVVPRSLLIATGIPVHLAVAPAICVSFLGLGVFLVPLSYIWYRLLSSKAEDTHGSGGAG